MIMTGGRISKGILIPYTDLKSQKYSQDCMYLHNDIYGLNSINNGGQKYMSSVNNKILSMINEYQELLDEFPVVAVIFEYRSPHRILFISNNIENVTGFTSKEFMDDAYFYINHVHEEHREHFEQSLLDFRNHGHGRIKHKFLFQNGNYHWIDLRLRLWQGQAEAPEIVLGTLLDINNEEMAYEILKSREEIFRIASWCSNDLIYEKNINTGKLVWYADIDKALKYEHGEFPRTIEAWKESLHPNDADRVIKAMEKHIADPSQPYDQEYLIRTKDGRYKIWIDHGQLIVRDGVNTGRIIGSCTDITKSKQEYLQIQKMETVGRLAGGIAHDFNNLLTAIIGFSDMALDEENIDENCRVYITEIKNAGELASSLTRQLLAFSRKQVFNIQKVNLNEIVRQTDKLIRRLIGENIAIDLSLDPELNNTEVDSSQIQQVIMNLSVNANDAMPGGGTLFIETYNKHFDENIASTYSEIIPGEYVALTIRDTGQGISNEDVSRIFEPFFTTKGKGKGTGLGLSTVYGIIKQSKGYIYAESEIGKGTEFRIYLPAVTGEEEFSAETDEDIIRTEGNECLLLVEDEALVRKLSETALVRKGYHILVARSAEEALPLFEENRDRINMLITDIVMPGMNGMQLAEKLIDVKSDLKVIFMSGYTDNIISQHDMIGEKINLLEKPFSPEDLTSMVRSVIDET